VRFAKKAIQLLLTSVVILALTAGSTFLIDRLLPVLFEIPSRYYAFEPLADPGSTATFYSADFHYTARANSLGLRGPEVALEKGDAYRVLVIGSSYVYGWGVNEEETWVRQVEQQLIALGHQVEVLNLGRNGGNPEQYAALALEAVPLLQPDMVLVALGQGVDIAWAGERAPAERTRLRLLRLYPNFTAWMKMRKALPPAAGGAAPSEHPGAQPPVLSPEQIQQMREAQKDQTRALARQMQESWTEEQAARFARLPEEPRAAFLAGHLNPGVIDIAMKSPNLYTIPLDMNSPNTQGCMDRLEMYLQEIQRVSDKHGGICLAVSVPFGAYVNEPAYQNYLNSGFEPYPDMPTRSDPDAPFAAVCNDINLPLLTVTEAFRARREDPNLFFKLDLHLATPGQKLLASEVAPYLAEHFDE
jgi:lysophospholipase L1-like esterase